MRGQGRTICGLSMSLLGVLGVSLACGLPMWRETSLVGANIVTAQTVWEGLWLQCVIQATGQMQCNKQTMSTNMTIDIQAGRALTLISIVVGLLGFIVTVLGGGVVNCSGQPPDPYEPPSASSSKKKVSLLGGVLCVLAGILCLIAVSWSAALTISVFNNALTPDALKREVGSSIYIGWASCVLLLLGGVLICFICGKEEAPEPSYYYMPYNSRDSSSRMATFMSDDTRSDTTQTYHYPRGSVRHVAQVHQQNYLSKPQSVAMFYNQPQPISPEWVHV
ncbi:claudin-4-like [Mugil cephalus]|uniref:claudin-4-like n=1 Tax=Mugil cephalus TaxID=48193 RepID=UPI001FB7E977|nr:claudin-4-like [Mugil cephalus]